MLPAKCRFLQQTAGFTLVELLLALVMFATIAGVIFASFAAVADGADKGRQSAELFRIGRGVLQRLTQEIEGALWYEDDPNTRWIGEDDTTDGQPRDRLTFVTIPYRSFGSTPEGDLCDVSYFIAENVEGHTALFRTEDCTLDSERQEEDTPRLELTDLAVGLDVTYYDAEGAHDEWPPGRQDNAPLPCRVRVALTLRDPQGYERVFITTVPVFMRGTCEEASH